MNLHFFLFSIQAVLPSDLAPESLDYEHLTLTEQLNDYGIRNLEIDIYNDPIGGQFSKRKLNALVGESVNANIPSLFDPGFKVLHIPDVDYNTHNFTFKSAIQEIKNWSDANQDHLPIFIYIEPKETSVENYLPFLPFSKAHVPDPLIFAEPESDEWLNVFAGKLFRKIV